MFSLKSGKPLAKIEDKNNLRSKGTILYLKSDDDKCCNKCSAKCNDDRKCCGGCNFCCNSLKTFKSIDLDKNQYLFKPIIGVLERSVSYIAGPSGSGKSSYAAGLMQSFHKIFPEKDIFVFSRTDAKNDPVFKGIKFNQINVDESLINDPIDITTELSNGALVLFDDCNTIQNDKLKKIVDSIMNDIMEVGRKLNIWIIITNHLVIPNERKMARTIMNEMQNFTFFPKSGTVQQISYCLKTYFGLSKKQIQKIIELDSRWVTIYKNYPMCIVYDHGAFIL